MDPDFWRKFRTALDLETGVDTPTAASPPGLLSGKRSTVAERAPVPGCPNVAERNATAAERPARKPGFSETDSRFGAGYAMTLCPERRILRTVSPRAGAHSEHC